MKTSDLIKQTYFFLPPPCILGSTIFFKLELKFMPQWYVFDWFLLLVFCLCWEKCRSNYNGFLINHKGSHSQKIGWLNCGLVSSLSSGTLVVKELPFRYFHFLDQAKKIVHISKVKITRRRHHNIKQKSNQILICWLTRDSLEAFEFSHHACCYFVCVKILINSLNWFLWQTFQSQHNISFCHSACFKTKIKVETTLVATGSPFLPLLDTPPLFADNEICQRRGLLEKLEKPFPSGIKVWSNFVLVQKS